MIENKLVEHYPVVIVGSGIAGSALSHQLAKSNGLRHLVITSQDSPLKNTSSLSYANCRITPKNEIRELVNECVEKYGQDRDKLEYIFSNSHKVKDLFEELGVDYNKTSFGIMPNSASRGGIELLMKLQKKSPVATDRKVLGFQYCYDKKEVSTNYLLKVLSEDGECNLVRADFLVLATGGFAGGLLVNDNVSYNCSNLSELIGCHGGSFANNDCILYHPFGYNNGKAVLTEKEVPFGRFVDSSEKDIFSGRLRSLIRENKYHDSFPEILEVVKKINKTDQVYFLGSGIKRKIVPTAHYTAGGIVTDKIGQVIGCHNLYAIGEVQADGNKNGGRIPGYPFTAAIVQAEAVKEDIIDKYKYKYSTVVGV